MPRIADYVVISDKLFELSKLKDGGFQAERQFHLGPDVHLGSQSILAFVLYVFDGAKNLAVRVKINGSTEYTATVTFNGSGARFNSIHEVVSGGVLVHGTNTITFNATDGVGKYGFGDVVLFCQRDI